MLEAQSSGFAALCEQFEANILKELSLIKNAAQKVIQQLREEYPTSSVDGDAEDANAGAR